MYLFVQHIPTAGVFFIWTPTPSESQINSEHYDRHTASYRKNVGLGRQWLYYCCDYTSSLSCFIGDYLLSRNIILIYVFYMQLIIIQSYRIVWCFKDDSVSSVAHPLRYTHKLIWIIWYGILSTGIYHFCEPFRPSASMLSYHHSFMFQMCTLHV